MRYKKTLTSINVIFLTLMVILSTSKAVTIGDSTVSVDINDEYYWIVTKHSEEALYTTGDKFNLTVQNVDEMGGYLVMDAKLDYYNNTKDNWTTPINGLFLSFNETLDEIEYQVGLNFLWGWIFIIPIPLNLTLIGEYINDTATGSFESMRISNTTLSLEYSQIIPGYGESLTEYRYTYNENGILTNFEIESRIGTISYLIHKMVMGSDLPDNGGDNGDNNAGDIQIGIPFGNSYILITIMGIFISIISIKRKIIKN